MRDGCNACVTADFGIISERHAVDIRQVNAFAREHDTSYQDYHFDNNVPNRSPVQQRFNIYNSNPRPRRGREVAIEKQIEGKTLTPSKTLHSSLRQ